MGANRLDAKPRLGSLIIISRLGLRLQVLTPVMLVMAKADGCMTSLRNLVKRQLDVGDAKDIMASLCPLTSKNGG